MSSEFGKKIKFSFYGQSHSAAVGVVIDGLPSGFALDFDQISDFMRRRAPGNNAFSTPRKEADIPEIISGIHHGKTCGAPLCAMIKNTDVRSGDYAKMADVPRPSHADYTARIKYGEAADHNGGGHFSARLTAPLCFAGAVSAQMLAKQGISITSRIKSIGSITDDPIDLANPPIISGEFPVVNPDKGAQMQAAILKAKAEGDSLGGVVECIVVGVATGLGSPLYDGVENRIAQAIFGIPAVKGIAFGNGFDAVAIKGSQNNDPFCFDGDSVKTTTNNSGGINGGITNGMPIVFSVAFKPTPSIAIPQKTVDLCQKCDTTLEISGRHDPCVVLRACPCVESIAATVILDMLMEEGKWI